MIFFTPSVFTIFSDFLRLLMLISLTPIFAHIARHADAAGFDTSLSLFRFRCWRDETARRVPSAA